MDTQFCPARRRFSLWAMCKKLPSNYAVILTPIGGGNYFVDVKVRK